MADWQENYELGKKAFKDNHYAEAMVLLEKVLRDKQNFADVYNMLGVIYYNANRSDEAINAFKKSLNINPRYTEASLNLSVVYNELGEFEKAQEVYAIAKVSGGTDKNTYLDPYVMGRLANMHAEIATIYKDLGRCDNAVQEYKMALELRPDFADLRVALGAVYRDMKDFKNSVTHLKEAINLRAEYLTAYVQLGLTYYAMEDMKNAKEQWLKVLSKDAGNKLAHMYLGMIDKKK